MDKIEKNKEKPEPSSIEIEIRKILIGANLMCLTSSIFSLIFAIISNIFDLSIYFFFFYFNIGYTTISLYLSITGKTLPGRFGRTDAANSTLGAGIGQFSNLLILLDISRLNPFLILIIVFIVMSAVIPILGYKNVIKIKKEEGLIDDKIKRNLFGIKFDQSEDKKTRKAIMREKIVILKTLALASRKEDHIDLEEFSSQFKMNIEEMKEYIEDLVQNGNIYRVNGVIEGNTFKFIK